MRIARATLPLACLLLSGCFGLYGPPDQYRPDDPLRPPRETSQEADVPLATADMPVILEPGFFDAPRPPGGMADGVLGRSRSSITALLEEQEREPISLNVDGMTIPAFINEVYGNLLGIPFQIDPNVERVRDLVTFRVPDPRPAAEIHSLVVDVLESYGLVVAARGQSVRIAPTRNAPAGEPPLIVSGRTLPSVPVDHRTVFQLVWPRNVGVSDLSAWMQRIFEGQEIQVSQDSQRNVIMLRGAAGRVREALRLIDAFDQPNMSDRLALRVEPRYWEAEALANRLTEVLRVEGYNVGNSASNSVVMMPIEERQLLLVFASTRENLLHVEAWIRQLDEPGQLGGQDGLFYYSVRNTSAENIVGVLQAAGLSTFTSTDQGANAGTEIAAPLGAAGTAIGGGRLITDPFRNGILYSGDSESWQRMLPVIERMDQPDKLVLIEVTIAEISLTDDIRSGVEWLFRSGHGDLDSVGRTLGGLGVFGSGSGFTYTLDNAGSVRAVLTAFERSDQARILSTPRIMVKSGSSASIDVGRQVPIITSRAQGGVQDGGNSVVLQQVSLINTGVILSVTPVVYSGDRVSLNIQQTVSEAQPNTSSNIDSPEIKDNSIQTELVLRDGGSILLGGLISTSATKSAQKVPLLGDIPGLGRLFRSDGEFSTRQELLMLVVPYVVENQGEAQDITRAYRDRLELVE